ncbi:hypothetical protein QOZ80_7BG0612170 [Eleusine coracana subsp. coracana]|nr:hypothetical protein QOZ80_7BG0612170 [Eleusine coracana subsp. coracana]
MDIHIRPRPPSHAAPSAALPSFRMLGYSRSGSFVKPLPDLNLKMQMGMPRLRHVYRCSADEPLEPSPENSRIEWYRRFQEKMDKHDREYGAAIRALGAGSSQDAMIVELEFNVFREEDLKIQTYVEKIASDSSILDTKDRGLALMFCTRIGMSIHLCAMIMAHAHLRIGAPNEMSLNTVEQIIRESLAAISLILAEDALAAVNNLEDITLKYTTEYSVKALNYELQCKLKELKMQFTEASEREAYELVWPTVTNATDHVSLFVIQMSNLRKKAVIHVHGH